MSEGEPVAPAYDFALVTALRPTLVAYARKLARDADEAEDVVQEALVHAFAAWPRFVPDPTTTIERAVSSWMYRCVHNHFVKRFRKAKVRAHLNVRMDTETSVYSASHASLSQPARDMDSDRRQTQTVFWPAQRTHAVRVAGQYAPENPDGRKTIDGLGDEIEAALGDLPPQHREILERVMLRDGKYHEVARELGIPIGTVMSSINRARNRMIARLGAWAAAEYGITDQREARP